MGSTVSRACVGLAEITMKPTKSNHSKTSTKFIGTFVNVVLLGLTTLYDLCGPFSVTGHILTHKKSVAQPE